MRFILGSLVDDALALLLTFQAIALGQLVFYPYSIFTIGSLAWYEARILGSLAPISPLLVVLLLYSWLVVLILKYAQSHSLKIASLIQPLTEIVRRPVRPSVSREEFVLLRNPRLLLIIAMTVGGLLCCLPYLPELNPNRVAVGVDTPTYIQWTSQMLGKPLTQALMFAFGQADSGFRPLPLLLFYSIASLGFRPDLTVEFSPLILAPLLSLSTYVFVNVGTGDRGTAAIAALVSAFSFDETVGVWAGYLANWIAMILAYFFFACFLTLDSSRRKALLVPLFLLSLALLLTHPWTWALVMVATLVFAVTAPRAQRIFSSLSTVALVAVGIGVDLVKNQIAGGTTLASDLGTKGPVFGISQLLTFWPNVWGASTVLYDGLLGNALLLGLGMFPFIFTKLRKPMQGALGSWVASASIPFALLNSFHQSRLLYDMPIPPLVAIATISIMSRAGGGNLRASLILLVIMSILANYGVASIIQA